MSICNTLNDCDYDYEYESDDDRLQSLDELRLALSTAPFFANHHYINRYNSQVSDSFAEHKSFHSAKCAIYVKNVCFSYQKNHPILNNFSIEVPKGCIYALLGSNSSGKTTLLKCLIGRLKPSNGTILVFGTHPGQFPIPGIGVGYMPQEIALYNELTIDETLQYFGHLYHLPMAIIYQRINFLLSLFHLPDENKLIGELTDNHRWRISLAVSLIHSPPLLLLDEPTVNVDPLLRRSIWNHLKSLCEEEGLTVLITTHYFGEAIEAHKAGLIRNGSLLAEDDPKELLTHFNTNSMETVFLKLCQIDDQYEYNNKSNNSSNHSKSRKIIYSPQISRQKSLEFAEWPICESKVCVKTNCINFSVIRLLALVRKNFYQMRGNLITMLFFFLFPSFQMALFFCASIGKEVRNINVAVYNCENPQYLSRTFLRALDNHMIVQQKYLTLDSAINAVESGNAWSAVVLSPNFTQSIKLRFTKQNLTQSEQNTSNIMVYIDLSNPVIGQNLLFAIIKSSQKIFNSYVSDDYHINTNIVKYSLPINVDQVIYGSKNPEFIEFLAPGYIIAIIFVMPLILTAYLVIKDQIDGHLSRCISTGALGTEALLSHLISQLVILVFQETIVLTVSFIIFQVPVRGSICLLITIVYLQGVCGIAFGLLISAISPNAISAVLITSAAVIPGVLLTGITWPIESMPSIMKFISYALPLTLPIESLRCIISRGMTIWYFKVMIGFTISIIYCVVIIIAAIIIFKWKTENFKYLSVFSVLSKFNYKHSF